ncbi:MAG: hypothetical protein DRJ39_02445 [Thermoprotei archaeon]|nr:MAG: hypothetical protein DRJ39_02445 [Thermoprotei archaeon]
MLLVPSLKAPAILPNRNLNRLHAFKKWSSMKVICFDLGNTLVKEKKEDKALREDGIKALYRELKLAEKGIEYKAFQCFHDNIWNELELAKLKFREIDIIRLFKILVERFKIYDVSLDHLIKIYFYPKIKYVELFPDVEPTLQKLKKAGFKLVLISNAYPSNKMVFEHFNLQKFFDHAFFSYEIGLRKPHPDIFFKALDSAGSNPGNSIMVGNDPFSDIAGSKLVGMKSVLIVRHGIENSRILTTPDFIIHDLSELTRIVRRLI